MQKISKKTIELILNEAFKELNLSLPLTEDDVDKLHEYFWDIEVSLSNAKGSYNEKVDEEYLDAVCKSVDELDDIDVEYLNSRLLQGKK